MTNQEPLKLAIVGFRHGHIGGQINAAKQLDNLQLVATCEENDKARQALEEKNHGVPVFSSYTEMLREVECDIIGIGDYFGIRGRRAIAALQAGKHVLSDKPLCTNLEELGTIKVLSGQNKLQVGCQLDMRGNGNMLRLRQLIQDGELGEVHAINFGGQHPLNLDSRPAWYFEPGKQGGTINDIGIHAFDFVPWLTGQAYDKVIAAREWNARVPQLPEFREAAQIMLSLKNGCGVTGDISYLTPESFGYVQPQYWRTTVWGEKGMAETHPSAPSVEFYPKDSKDKQELEPLETDGFAPIKAFLQEINGESSPALTTAEVLRSSYVSLATQKAADDGATYVDLGE